MVLLPIEMLMRWSIPSPSIVNFSTGVLAETDSTCRPLVFDERLRDVEGLEEERRADRCAAPPPADTEHAVEVNALTSRHSSSAVLVPEGTPALLTRVQKVASAEPFKRK